jgi:hypothetical protein
MATTNAAKMLSGDNPADEAKEYSTAEGSSTNAKAAEFFMVLLMAAPMAHILHLQTRSFAEHMALNTLYSELPELTDTLIESYQGKYGIVENYPNQATMPPYNNALEFVVHLNKFVDDTRYLVCDDSEMQNAIDEIVTLLNSTTYKLKFLS